MKELEHYDELKQNLDKEIEEQQKVYKQFIQEYDNQLDDFDKAYEQSLSDLKKEEQNLDAFEAKVAELRNGKADVEKVIKDALEQLKIVSAEFVSQAKNIQSTENNIKKIKKDIISITGNVEDNKKENIQKLAKLVGSKREEIETQQDTLLKSAKLKVQEVQNYAAMGKKIYDGFENLFSKKIKTGDLITEIETEKDSLKKELEVLKRKVEVFSVLAKHPAVADKLGDIEKTLAAYEKRKDSLSAKINNLIGFIRGN